MSATKCTTCGRITNSATSNYWANNGIVTQCYLAVHDDKWGPGCAYDQRIAAHRTLYGSRFGRPVCPVSQPPVAGTGEEDED